MLALRASNGRLLWDSGEPLGWDALSGWKRREMSRGIGREDLVNAVATDGRVVVAPQQLPYSNSENDQVDGLTITVSLPERRLFAFDAVSGAPLWNHAPDAARRLLGLPLEFQQRARISAPPKIVGDLVLVPSYELVGRINLYVSAYDLFTGELVWSQLVVSGQTRVNLFGEHEVEFNSAPLATTEDAVFVATGLGVVACLDRTTGEPRWTQDYSRFKLPRTNGYYTPRTERRWHNSPPLLTDELLFVTPADSPDLLGIDLATGQLVLELDGDELEELASRSSEEGVRFDHLAAVDARGPWLAGDHLTAFDLEEGGGLATRFAPVPTPNSVSSYSGPAPHPRIFAPSPSSPLLAATEFGALAVDRATGVARELGPRDASDWTPGNLATAAGRLLVLSDTELTGWVSWDALIVENLAALELLAEPNDSARIEELRLELAEAYLARAAARFDDEEGLLAARALLFGPLADELGNDDPYGAERITHLRFELLNLEAVSLVAAYEGQAAFARFDEAYDLATEVEDQLQVLFRQFRLLGIADRSQAEGGWHGAARKSLIERLTGELARQVVPDGLLEELALSDDLTLVFGRLDPSLLELSVDLGPLALARIPLGYFGQLARAAACGRASDELGELDALHTALWEYGELVVTLGGNRADLTKIVSERIAGVLEQPAGRDAYSSFEEAAAERVELAKVAPAADRAGIFAGVVRRFPHSAAANAAEVELLGAELARLELGVGDLADLSRAAMPLVQRGGTTRARAYLALARGAVLAGNLELGQLFATRLVELDPTAAGARELAGPKTPTSGPPASERRRFQGPLATADGLAAVRIGSFTPLFPIQLSGPGDDAGEGELLLVASTNGDILAFEAGSSGVIRWTFPSGGYSSAPWSRRAVALPETSQEILCVIATGGLAGVDPRTGYLSWSRSPLDRRPVSLIGAGGLLIVEWTDGGGQRTLEGIDARGGTLLWEYELPANFASGVEGLRLLLAGTRICVLGRGPKTGALVLDATTGEALGDLALGPGTSSGDREAAWCADSKLFVPRLLAGTGGRPNLLEVFDLAGLFPGQATPASFSISLGAGQELAGVVHAPSGRYLWMIGVGPGRERGAGDALRKVEVELGALRLVTRLDAGERPLGLELGGTLEIDGDLLVVASSPGTPQASGGLRLRGIALPLGPLWSVEIASPTDSRWSLYDGPMPRALLSQTSVAFLYALSGSHASMGQELHLMSVDKKSGAIEQDNVLVARLGRVAGIELDGVGDELFLFGSGSSRGRGRLEVLGSLER